MYLYLQQQLLYYFLLAINPDLPLLHTALHGGARAVRMLTATIQLTPELRKLFCTKKVLSSNGPSIKNKASSYRNIGHLLHTAFVSVFPFTQANKQSAD